MAGGDELTTIRTFQGDIEVSIKKSAVCETTMGVAGYLHLEMSGHQVEIIASYDNEYAQDDDHPAGYVEHIKVDGTWWEPKEEAFGSMTLPFEVPGIDPEDQIAVEDLFHAVAKHLGFETPACPAEAAARRG